MDSRNHQDSVHYSLSDSDGDLRFKDFGVEGFSGCDETAQHLKDYFIGRSLSETDTEYLRGLAYNGNKACIDTVIEVLRECRLLFIR